MGTVRAVIADDESAARSRLRKLLAEADDIVVVAEAENGAEALASTLGPEHTESRRGMAESVVYPSGGEARPRHPVQAIVRTVCRTKTVGAVLQ